MNRRHLLGAAMAILPITLLAACKTPPSASQLASDVGLLATGLQPVVDALATTPGVSPDVVTQAKALLKTIQDDAKQVAAATANPPAGSVQAIVQAVQALGGITGTIPQLAPYSSVIQAALALLPIILALAGIPASAAKPGTMSPDAARAILAVSAATKH